MKREVKRPCLMSSGLYIKRSPSLGRRSLNRAQIFRNVRTVALPLGLLIPALLWSGCGHPISSPLEDLCAEHTVLDPDAGIVVYLNFEGYWRPNEREI